MSIYTKLFEIQKKNILLKADAENPFYKSKYVTIENIMTTLKPLLEEQGLLVYHSITSDSVITDIVETNPEGNSNTAIRSSFPINNQLDAQKIGAMVTYGKRYNLVALFALIEEDDDGNTLVNNAPKSFMVPSNVSIPPKTYKTPTGQLELIEYISKIKESSDSNEITVLVSEAKNLYKSEKQRVWLEKEAQERNSKLLHPFN